jgi:hypothetical protein
MSWVQKGWGDKQIICSLADGTVIEKSKFEKQKREI